MSMTPIARAVAFAALGSSITVPTLAQADLVEDSHASLELRNFYFNRDFRQSGARDNADEWAQGFLLRLESGFSEGTVGFGVDAIGLLGFKLDSGGDSGGTGLLPADGSAGGSQDDYAKLGLTAKGGSPTACSRSARCTSRARWSRPTTPACCRNCSVARCSTCRRSTA